ncbi:MAG: TlpA family protein disulfide reductase [Fimbriimonadaceae bacterium]|nr:TlpA family protein disulfide reductase [Fimbriimonadaceae bacterium]
MKTRTIAAILAVAVMAVLLGAGQAQKDPAAELKKWVGKPLPKFSMKTTDGKTVTNASYKNKVVLIDFWATWCGPCKEASPAVDALAKKYKSKGLEVIGATFQDESGKAKEYKAKHKYSYTFVDSADDLGKSIGIQGIPVFILVDKKGVIRHTFFGYSKGKSDKEFEKAIASLVK